VRVRTVSALAAAPHIGNLDVRESHWAENPAATVASFDGVNSAVFEEPFKFGRDFHVMLAVLIFRLSNANRSVLPGKALNL
jgi:hypothetical protein